MKKVILSVFMCFITVCVSAQIMRAEEFEKYAVSKYGDKWAIEKCYPFAEKDAYKAKKSSSKALVMSHAYSNVIMDKIEEAAKNGLVGNENDNW